MGEDCLCSLQITLLCFYDKQKTHSQKAAIHNMKWPPVLEFELRYFRQFPLAGSTGQNMDIQSAHVCLEQGADHK